MGLGSLIDSVSGAAKKAKDTVADALTGDNDEKEKDEKEQKEGEQNQAQTNDSTQESDDNTILGSKLLGDVWDETKEKVAGAFDWLTGGSGDDNLHTVELTENGQTLGPDGKPVDTIQRTGDNTQQPGQAVGADGKPIVVEQVDKPAATDPFDYDALLAEANASKKEEPGMVENLANWVGEQWDNLFCGGKAGKFETTDKNGEKHSTTMSDRGVDHVGPNGKAHVDGNGMVEVDEHGNKHVIERDGKQTTFYTDGGKQVKNPDGSIDMIGADGRKIHITPEGNLIKEVNGRRMEITEQFISQKLGRDAESEFLQFRNPKEMTPQEQMEAALAPLPEGQNSRTTAVTEDDGTTTVVRIDRHGNVLKVNRDRGEHSVTSAAAPDVELIKQRDEEGVRMRIRGQDFHVKHLRGEDGKDRWYLYRNADFSGHPEGWVEDDGSIYAYDKQDPRKVGERLGQINGVTEQGALQVGTGQVTANEQVQSTDEKVQVTTNGITETTSDGKRVAVNATSRPEAAPEGQNIGGSTVTVTHEDGKTDVSVVLPGGLGEVQVRTNVEVDQDGAAVTNEQGQVTSGDFEYGGTIDENGQPQHRIAFADVNGDGKIDENDATTVNVTPEGLRVQDVLNNVWNADGSFENGVTGTKWNSDGSVDFADGTSVDSNGNVYHNGTKVGSAGGFGSESDAGTAARVNSILALASSISASGSIDPGKIGRLLALYAELGVAQGAAIQSGNMAAFVQADLAKAVVAGAISAQQAAEARAEIAKYFTNHPLTNDQIAMLQNKLNGTSPELVRQFVHQNGWDGDQQRQQARTA